MYFNKNLIVFLWEFVRSNSFQTFSRPFPDLFQTFSRPFPDLQNGRPEYDVSYAPKGSLKDPSPQLQSQIKRWGCGNHLLPQGKNPIHPEGDATSVGPPNTHRAREPYCWPPQSCKPVPMACTCGGAKWKGTWSRTSYPHTVLGWSG